MQFPKLSAQLLLKRLEPPAGKVRMVLDTDTYNEVDDQFALTYALKSKEKIDLEAVYAAPFYNERSTSPKEGMELSYTEILKILGMLKVDANNFAFKGSTDYLKNIEKPEESDAVRDLINRAMKSDDDDPLYVVAIGAITNIASAMLIEPDIIRKIVVVWLGGNALFWDNATEFNLSQDILSARIVFDSGVPLVQIPCAGVTTHLLTTISELEQYIDGKSEIGTYLTSIVRSYTNDPFAWSKVIWDISTIAWLINPGWVPTHLVHSPIITDHNTWSFDQSRHFIRSAYFIYRDPIFADLFRKIAN
ncbi:nucleoside hydrolase [Clostridium thermosuccinogenes]|jgi:inosine-uridine nucleoside N-ribohydrolase|uniref:Nucleoside hydrolase n=1 Tax=Clostridium thermosuccinogenes TaxID=84032 RepID=A0A2K2FP46_9CLOT|nr:nucleoside hydrolase [Pseudoclostridium thermosuccinogenes]AUS96735.1 nucleoside hydrolase [Pseudoclostridium thermosuccinogenes]PNT97659.1 nucleoside hydrolase [Pseudoclostridium thermosuccinogenes]PNU00552.1 nucleoside hydrolase [Pseudoclostridium thermosuccinogenes]